MKGKRFSQEQIIRVIKESEMGIKNIDICRKYGISEQMFYNWKSKYGGMEVSDAMRPGSLTCQYKNPNEKSGSYWQLSYTRTMRSRSDYVRADCVAEVRKEIAAYKRFKALIEEWIDLGIESSKL